LLSTGVTRNKESLIISSTDDLIFSFEITKSGGMIALVWDSTPESLRKIYARMLDTLLENPQPNCVIEEKQPFLVSKEGRGHINTIGSVEVETYGWVSIGLGGLKLKFKFDNQSVEFKLGMKDLQEISRKFRNIGL
jgi:hypothetical protein